MGEKVYLLYSLYLDELIGVFNTANGARSYAEKYVRRKLVWSGEDDFYADTGKYGGYLIEKWDLRS